MKILYTTCNLKILVDNEDYEYLNQFKWHRLQGRNTVYARTNVKQKSKVLTHILAEKYKWDLINKVIDHKNKNGMDNRKENLQILSQRENVAKDAGWKKSSSKYRGVRKHRNKWLAEIRVKGQKYYLGIFETEVEAYAVVLEKRKEVGY